MTFYTHPLVLRLRSLGRTVGANRRIARLWNVLRYREYEQSVRRALAGLVRSGMCVWDIGANVGQYTRWFADLVGEDGIVVAFEPNPACLDILRASTQHLRQVRVLPIALGDRDGWVRLILSQGDAGQATRVDEEGDALRTGASGPYVRIARADTLIQSESLGMPTLIKIDVEGFEERVLAGMATHVLPHPALRFLCIEVHFGLLECMGVREAPRRIEQLLQQHRFVVRWIDPSHLLGRRGE